MIYEYECEVHGIFEKWQSIKDEPLQKCPHCEEEGKENPVKKLISLSAFHLSGGGWSRDNYS